MTRDYFSAGSLDYSRYRPLYPVAWFDWLVSHCVERELAWDCACGSGQATGDLAKRFARVVGTDASAEQLRNAPAIPNVEWKVAPGGRCGLREGTVDLITVAQALHWLDLEEFWTECRRALKAGGLVAAWGYRTANLGHAAGNRIFQDFHHRVLAGFWPEERRMVEEAYAEVAVPFEELAVPDFPMSQMWDAGQIAGYCASWSATTRYRKTTGCDPIPDFEKTLREAIGPEAVDICWPFFARVGRVHPQE